VSGAGYLTPAMSHRRSATGDCVLPVVRRVLLPARADAASWPRQVLRKQVQRVRDLHVPSQTVKSRISGLPVCCRCHDIYPCETLRALAGDGHE
jgi:hypothetical protein